MHVSSGQEICIAALSTEIIDYFLDCYPTNMIRSYIGNTLKNHLELQDLI
jgi:hypothetical protein